jgi:AraC family transcriptional regulator, ethanolamine operon transcriptional activator
VNLNSQQSNFRIVTRDAHDAFHHSSLAAGWLHTYDQLVPGRYYGAMTDAWLGPVQIAVESIEQPFSYRGHAWKGSRVFFSYLSGSNGVYYDGRWVAPDVLVSHRWDDVEAVISKSSTQMALVVVDEQVLQQHAMKLLGAYPFLGRASATTNPDSQVVRRFQRFVASILSELRANPSILANDHSRHELKTHVLDSLVSYLPSDRSAPRLPHPTTRAYVVKEAIRFIESNLAQPIGTSDICSAIGVCSRTLAYSFANVTGISPKQYVLVARLNRVRDELIRSRGSTPIQTIAARWGFWHMGRFSSQYKRTFGEPPSKTMNDAGSRTTSKVSRH